MRWMAASLRSVDSRGGCPYMGSAGYKRKAPPLRRGFGLGWKL